MIISVGQGAVCKDTVTAAIITASTTGFLGWKVNKRLEMINDMLLTQDPVSLPWDYKLNISIWLL